MGTDKFYNMFKSHFTHVDTMFRFLSTFLISVYALILKISGFVAKYVYRSKVGGNDSYFSDNHSKKDDQGVSRNSTDFLSSGLAEEESLGSEDSNGNNSKTEDSVFLLSGLIASNSNKYQFLSSKDVSGFIEKSKDVEFLVEEMFVGSNEDLSSHDQSLDCESSPKKDHLGQILEHNYQEFENESNTSSIDFGASLNSSCSTNGLEILEEEKAENVSRSLCNEEVQDEKEKSTSADNDEKEKSTSADNRFLRFEGTDSMEDGIMEDQEFSYEIELLPWSQSPAHDVNRESDFSGFKFLISPQKIVPNDEAFLEVDDSKSWKMDFTTANHHIIPEDIRVNMEEQNTDQTLFDFDGEYIELEFARLKSTEKIDEANFCRNDANKTEQLHEAVALNTKEMNPNDDTLEGKNFSWDSDSDDEDEADVLWEHQHLVQQMKMELKNCRIRGLPTISEDYETPKMTEDLKPLKIDQKFEYKDMMEQIQKFYRSYAEKMRKLDVLNFQTLQAISFLQLKDSELFTSGKKKSASMLKNLTVPRFWPGKVQRIYADPTLKSIVELNRDLELVYVGQLCLSWEIICWLYVKGKELLEYDSQGTRSFNRVVEEFQQFQVLMQRFMEDERFQGPRVQNYVKNRCVIRSLLQVPTIKDDCLKDKERREETDSIPLESLLQIIKESMMIFREFIRSDKGSKDVALNGIRGTKIDIQDPANSVLLLDIIASLQKKDRKLKENMRSKNCIVKKLQKREECRELFTCEVELRLISRFLNLSRLTADQLVWCQDKLNNINIVNRRVHVEPSFLLFPC